MDHQNVQLSGSLYNFVPIHKYPELVGKTATLINSEWPRSLMMRLHSLQESCDRLPCSLVLTSSDMKHVIGHVKINPIQNYPDSCFVQSVVVDKNFRGKGYGKLMMKLAEDYCRSKLDRKTIHLSSLDKDEFYKHIGYTYCEPISMFGPITSKFPRTELPSKKYMKKVL